MFCNNRQMAELGVKKLWLIITSEYLPLLRQVDKHHSWMMTLRITLTGCQGILIARNPYNPRWKRMMMVIDR
jgi:hypothetical protein